MKKTVGVVVVIVLVVLVIYFGWVNPLAVSNRKKCTIEVCDGRDNDCDKLTDEGLTINCKINSDCGANTWTGNNFCGADGNVHKMWVDYTCSLPGTCNSKCSSAETDKVYRVCNSGCLNGECKNSDSCTDTDNGQVPGVKGTVNGHKNNTIYNMTDYCASTYKVVEYYCSGVNASNIGLNCTNRTVCIDGACK